ncbi:MAG: VWA domain-containing protein [Planctomycetota bacterium]
MTWLTPWAAITAAAIALPLLLVLYMLKLRRRPVRVSAASLWAEAADDLEANVPFRRPRASWLLLVQFLALLALLAALGRPAINAQADAGARAIILIDTSASMRAPAGSDETTRFDIARDRALEFIDRLGETGGPTEAALFAVAAEPVALTPMTRSKQELRRALNELEPTDEPADLAAALELASTLARRSNTDAGADAESTTRIWLFGDGGYNDTDLTASTEVAFISTLDPDLQETPEAQPDPDNVGVIAFAARRDFTDPAVVRVLATIAHASPRERALTARLLLNGREIERTSLTLPPAVTDAQGQTQLAERALSFSLTTTTGGLLEISLTPGGVLQADDRAALVLDPARAPAVRWNVPDADATIAQGPRAWVLGDILNAMNLGRVDRVAANAPFSTTPDLIIHDRTPINPESPVPALAFLAPTPEAETTPTRVIAWERDHPALRHAPLDRLIVPNPAALPEPDEGVERVVLARGRTQPLIVEDRAPGVRRILVAFDPVETDWPLQPGFPVFVASAIDYLTVRAERDAGRAWATGQTVTINSASAAPNANVTDPQGRPVATTQTTEGLAFRPANAGVYRLTDTAGERPIPVNLTDRTEIAASAASEIRIAGQTVTSGDELAGPVELWRYLVLAAGLLLVLEWFVYVARARI